VIAVVVGGGWFLSQNPDWLKTQLASFKAPSTELKVVNVRELVLDGKALIDEKAYVQVTGVYLAFGESGSIYPPSHKALDSDTGFTVDKRGCAARGPGIFLQLQEEFYLRLLPCYDHWPYHSVLSKDQSGGDDAMPCRRKGSVGPLTTDITVRL